MNVLWTKQAVAVRVPADTVPDDIDAETPDWLSELEADLEMGLRAVADSLREKYGDIDVVVES